MQLRGFSDDTLFWLSVALVVVWAAVFVRAYFKVCVFVSRLLSCLTTCTIWLTGVRNDHCIFFCVCVFPNPKLEDVHTPGHSHAVRIPSNLRLRKRTKKERSCSALNQSVRQLFRHPVSFRIRVLGLGILAWPQFPQLLRDLEGERTRHHLTF